MSRDTKIAARVFLAIPLAIVGAAVACTYAIANGASERWRLLFRMMCHGFAPRCLELWNVPMPICARCTGLYAGLFLGLLVFCALRIAHERALRLAMVAAATPMAIDGLTQLTGLRESVNPLRIATGLVAGFAFGLWVLSAIERRGERAFTTS